MSVIFLIYFFLFINNIESYKILGIFHFPVHSHYTVFDSLMVELANRGHQVTVFNSFPKNFQIENYREINVKHCFPLIKEESLEKFYKFCKGALDLVNIILQCTITYEEISRCEPIVKLLNSSNTYDILFTEIFDQNFFQLFGYKFKIPVITFHSSFPFPWMSEQMALSQNPSYIPHPLHTFPIKMNFFERIKNTLLYLHSIFMYKFYSTYKFEKIALTFFGSSVPLLRDFVKNTSIMFTYSHPSLTLAWPTPPNVIEVGGLHIKKPKTLPEVCSIFVYASFLIIFIFNVAVYVFANCKIR